MATFEIIGTFETVKAAFLFEKATDDSTKLGTVPRGTAFKGKHLDSGFIETTEPVQVKKADGSMAAATGFIFFLGFAGRRQEEVVAMGGNDNEVLCASVTDAAREASTDRDYLLAAAYVLSKNLTDLGIAAGRAGPFAYSAAAWEQATATESGAAKALGVSPQDRLRWYMQPRVAAFVAAAQAKAFKDAVGRPPNFNELFFVQLLGDGAIGIVKDKTDGRVAAAVNAAALAPDLAAELTTTPVTVDGVLEKLQARLDAAYNEASKVIALQPPEIRLFRAQSGDAPWMAVARDQMSAGVAEDAGRRNTAQIDAYFTTVDSTPGPTTPWCGAFVGFCVKQCGVANIAATVKPASVGTKFWEDWGEPAVEPFPVGSIVVLTPAGSAGHVGFLAENSTAAVINLLGGNQGGHGTGPDKVGIVPFPVATNPIVAVRTMPAPAHVGLADGPAQPPGPVGPGTAIAWGAKVRPAFKQRLIEICNTLACSPDHMMAAMAFETGERFTPDVRNQGGSGATGLIQFMPATAQGLGTTTAALAAMTDVEQLEFVLKYFLPHKGRMNTVSDLYMAILWPIAVGTPENTTLFRSPERAYEQNKGLDKNGDGVVTKAEAAAKVVAMLAKGLGAGFKG